LALINRANERHQKTPSLSIPLSKVKTKGDANLKFPFLRPFSGYPVALDIRCWQNRRGEVSASTVQLFNVLTNYNGRSAH
jgi:hypothetical protein